MSDLVIARALGARAGVLIASSGGYLGDLYLLDVAGNPALNEWRTEYLRAAMLAAAGVEALEAAQ